MTTPDHAGPYRTPGVVAERTLNLGDLVRHRAGGPIMVIEFVNTDIRCSFKCSWFDADVHAHCGNFSLVEIELVERYRG